MSFRNHGSCQRISFLPACTWVCTANTHGANNVLQGHLNNKSPCWPIQKNDPKQSTTGPKIWLTGASLVWATASRFPAALAVRGKCRGCMRGGPLLDHVIFALQMCGWPTDAYFPYIKHQHRLFSTTWNWLQKVFTLPLTLIYHKCWLIIWYITLSQRGRWAVTTVCMNRTGQWSIFSGSRDRTGNMTSHEQKV